MSYQTKRFQKGEVILTEGEIGKGFCILEEGTLQVTHEGKILNEIDQKGAIFGELSELLMYKRNASIHAKTDAKVRKYPPMFCEKWSLAQNSKHFPNVRPKFWLDGTGLWQFLLM